MGPRLDLLGQALRGFREATRPKKMSQFRLASLMRWEGTAPVIEIEKGRRRPRPETLNALGEALGLSAADVAYLHGLAGYREVTALPPDAQVRRVLEQMAPDLARRPFPVQVLDYRFRHWMANSATATLLGSPPAVVEHMVRTRVHGFNALFDSRLPVRACFVDPEAAERERVYRFKAHNLYRRHEPFYLAYPGCLETQLPEPDFRRFARAWQEVEVVPQVFPVHPEVRVRIEGQEVTFVIHMVELLHLDRLLLVAYWEPRTETDWCRACFSRVAQEERRCFTAWDGCAGL